MRFSPKEKEETKKTDEYGLLLRGGKKDLKNEVI